MERASFRMPALRHTRWLPCVLWGVFFAIVFTYFCIPDSHSGLSQAIKHVFEGVGAISGFCFGFGHAWKSQISARTNLHRQVQKLVLFRQVKFGTERMVSWNNESFTVTSPMSQLQFNWLIIDKIVNGKVGIYLLCGDEVIFELPKAVIPKDTSEDELIKIWRGLSNKLSKSREFSFDNRK